MTGIVETPVRVTVIIPAYKASLTLEKAVISVLSQTERDLEVIIVDDCSPDGTAQVAERLATQDRRIRLIRLTENRGKSFALNYATLQARGKWIAVLDSDDWYAPERLEYLINTAELKNVAMVADNLWNVDSKADKIAGTALPLEGAAVMLDLDAFLHASNPMANFDYGMLKPIFLKDFIRQHAVNYYESARIGEDFYILLCFFAAGGKAYVSRQPYYYYVQPYGTISRKWAQEDRKRYNFKLLKQVHDHFLDIFRTQLTSGQLRLLLRRGECIQAMEHFHRLRECLSSRNMTGALHYAVTAPRCLWRHIGGRAVSRLLRLLSLQHENARAISVP